MKKTFRHRMLEELAVLIESYNVDCDGGFIITFLSVIGLQIMFIVLKLTAAPHLQWMFVLGPIMTYVGLSLVAIVTLAIVNKDNDIEEE